MRKLNLEFWGLIVGPVVVDSEDRRVFSYSSDNPNNDSELFDLFSRFTQENPRFSRSWGKDFNEFAKDNGYEVIRNDYVDNVYESMTKSEADEFIERLKSGEVHFKFKKVDGTMREARGTLKQDLIPTRPSEERIEGARRTHRVPDSVIVFWDLDKEAFRSFRKDNFEGYLD